MTTLHYVIVKGEENWAVFKQVWTALGGVDTRFAAQFDSWNECTQYVNTIINSRSKGRA